MSFNPNAQLGATIRQKRILLGLTQGDVGKRIGVTFQQVQKYEAGKDQVTFARLVQLAKALEISVSDLVTAAQVDDKAVAHDGISDRQTLELMKRLEKLTPNQRRGVQLLVHHLVEIE